MNEQELINNKKELANVKDILKDTLQADPEALKRLDSMNLNMNAIKMALEFLYSNPSLDEKDRNQLVQESWRVNFRDRPPTPEEFLTEKYLGPTAKTIYPRIKKVFLEFMAPTNSYRKFILYPFIGYGKALPPVETVFTLSGPREMKDIKIGDKVCNTYGGYSTVTGKLDFPEEKVYELTFNDGRKVLACGNHNWKAFHSDYNNIWDKEKGKYVKADHNIPCWKVISTEDIIRDLEEHPNHIWRFPLTEPVKHEENNHVISPYTLGAFLGDGSCVGKQASLNGDDLPILERIKAEYNAFKIKEKTKDKSTTLYNGAFDKLFVNELEKLGLKGKKCNDKFIPRDYLYDSIENRIALLQGLMDTDGTLVNNGPKSSHRPKPSFWTASKQLAEDIVELVRGLGGLARTYFCPKGTSSAKNYDAYIVNFSFPKNNFNVFYLDRKQKPLTEEYRRVRGYKEKRKPQYLILKSIKERKDMKGGQCIEVDSDDHCFLTRNYIVTHNSFCSTLITLYIATHLSLMRDPWKYFGLSPASLLCQFLCSYSLKKSSELLLEPFNAMLEASPYFTRVHSREKMIKANEEYEHMDHINEIFYTTASPTSELAFAGGSNIKLVSNPQGLLGASVVSAVLSELAFFIDAGKSYDYIMRMWNDCVGRVNSRMKGNYYGRCIIDSSPNDLSNPIDHYVWYDAPKDPSAYIVKGAMWEWLPEEYDFSETFKVYTGGQGNPPRILEEGDPLLESENNPKIIEIPMWRKNDSVPMIQYFKDDLVKSIKDMAGIPSGSANSLIYDYARLESIFNNGLRNMYEDIHAPAELNPNELIWDQIKDTFFKYRAGQFEYYYKPKAPRCIAVDQSTTTDMTGISMVHAERYLDTGELIYVVDFTIAISPEKDSKVNLEAIRCFIKDLRDKGHIRIEAVGFDSFESATTLQNLERDGFNVKKVSTDKSMDPYINMLALINSGRLAVGRNIFLKNNIKSLNVVGGTTGKGKTKKLKIDHDDSREVIKVSGDHKWETSPLGMYSKDISDSMVDAIELCRVEFPIVEEQWWGPVKREDFSYEKEKEKAQSNLNNFLNKFGLR